MAAEAARRESLEERRAFPGRTRPQTPLLCVALGVLMQAGLIGQIWCPTDRGRVGVMDDTVPLGHRAAHHRRGPSPRSLTRGIARTPAVDEGPGIGGVGDDAANGRFRRLTPEEVPVRGTADVAPRQADVLLLTVAQDSVA
jgi:hypothetical protein